MIFLEQNFSFESLPLGEKISLCVLGLGILLFFWVLESGCAIYLQANTK